MNTFKFISAVAAITLIGSGSAFSAINLDRTRLIITGNETSASMTINNQNEKLPYLAQAWLEDDKGNKVQSPFVVLPPLQRVEPKAKSQVKIQVLPAASTLPQDRESVYYFNLREIPLKSNKPNVLQLALQTRIKMFYRPESLVPAKNAAPWQEKITLSREGSKYVVNNPTPYFVTLSDATSTAGGKTAEGFEPIMISPKSSMALGASSSVLGNSPVLTYINDYGGRPKLEFSCGASNCSLKNTAK
ncbi:fimbria/pilus periplasmic chaperone [Pantoea sp. 1.19]|uniref:fimbria/pilus periplasmic chaperone n=1 Tax=Pantoea sp. 1.19 TaxID=1925589 RepID=UPI0009489946|nr:fimbria/pilus periplasmic chaperone [Pantoea sp. 1.19]